MIYLIPKLKSFKIMKAILPLITLLLINGFSLGQSFNPAYDSTLAVSLGADDYGMKKYVLVILKTGTNSTNDKEQIKQLFAGHMSNMEKLVDQGKLIVAGPIGKNEKTYRGIFILNTSTFEEANLLLESDPAIKEKLLEPEFYNWYGSAALPEYLKASDKIWKLKP